MYAVDPVALILGDHQYRTFERAMAAFAKRQRHNQAQGWRSAPFRRMLACFIILAGIGNIVSLLVGSSLTRGQPSEGTIQPPDYPLQYNHHRAIEPAGTNIESTPPPSNSDNESTQPTSNRDGQRKKTDVIVYLAQFGNHSSYGAQFDANHKVITGLSKLNRSLELLYTNYANQFPTDVIVFYEALLPPDADTVRELTRNRPRVELRPLGEEWWSLPYGLKSWEILFWKRPAFSVGYRLMMRWFAVLIWRYLHAEGYTHVMRLDDDSYIHSPIKYNLFQYMRDNNKRYGFRQPVYEGGGPDFDKVVDRYLSTEGSNTSTPRELVEVYKQDRGVAFYNNFFLADISFFLAPPASTLLRMIDESKLMFTERTGDLVIQSAIVRLFLPPEQIHWFRDFTYEHMTLCRKEKCGMMVFKGCPQNGGVSRGEGVYSDDEWRQYSANVLARFKNNAKRCFVPINQHFVGAEDVRTCSRLQSRCGDYLRLISGANSTREDREADERMTMVGGSKGKAK